MKQSSVEKSIANNNKGHVDGTKELRAANDTYSRRMGDIMSWRMSMRIRIVIKHSVTKSLNHLMN